MKVVRRNLIRLCLITFSLLCCTWNILLTGDSRHRITEDNSLNLQPTKPASQQIEISTTDGYLWSNESDHFNSSTSNIGYKWNRSKHDRPPGDERTGMSPLILPVINDRYDKSTGYTIDIISIGSITRADYQLAQQTTMGQHYSVRYYFPITEKHDSERDCHTNLTETKMKQVLDYCGGKTSKPHEALEQLKVLYIIEKYLKRKKNPLGWMCAQKRFSDGFHLVANFYSKFNQGLPDHLMIIDDDTYYNFDTLLAHKEWPVPSVPMVLAGCLFRHRYRKTFTFNFPFGGFGITLTRSSLENFLRPIHCEYPRDERDHQVCEILDKNYAGEQSFFQDGMSLSDLMHKYTSEQRYLDVEHWNGPGYCFHSDWTLPFFIKFYGEPIASHMLRAFDQSFVLIGKRRDGRLRGQCLNLHDSNCGVDSPICHYISPGRMIELYANASS